MIIDVVEPPKPKDVIPVMSLDLEQALSAIRKGAEERLEVLKTQKKMIEQGETLGETIPQLIGHIEKMEPGDDDESVGGAVDEEMDVGGKQMADTEAAKEKEVGGRQMADKEA